MGPGGYTLDAAWNAASAFSWGSRPARGVLFVASTPSKKFQAVGVMPCTEMRSAELPVQLERERNRAARIVVVHVEHAEIHVVSLRDIVVPRAGRERPGTLPDQIGDLARQ
jgi:hypothetical protein